MSWGAVILERHRLARAARAFAGLDPLQLTRVLLLVGLSLFLMWPIAAVLFKSVHGPTGLTLESYRRFFTAYYYRSFLNTLLLGAITTIIAVTAGFCIAYVTTKGPRWLRSPLKWVTLLPLVAPPYIFALSLIMLFGRRGFVTQLFGVDLGVFGFKGVVIAQTLAFVPLAYLILENLLTSLDPAIEDSAANLGASQWKIMRTIVLPLLKPGFVKAALVVYVMAVAEFGNVAILAGRTPFLAPDIYTVITGVEADLQLGSALSTFLMIPVMVIFLVQNRLYRGKGYVTISGKPTQSEPRALSWLLQAPMIAVSIIVSGLILLSFGTVAVGAFTKIVGVNNTLTLAHMVDSRVNDALLGSLKVSLLAGALGSVIGILAAYVTVRGRGRLSGALEGFALAGFALPGTVLGIGYLLVFNGPPLTLTGTMIILVLNCAFRFAAVAMEAGVTKLHQLSIEIEEASLNLGADSVTTFRRIVLPIIFPAAVYGFVYVFMTTMVSLSAVVFLTSPAHPLVSVFIFQWAQYGYVGLASAATVKVIGVVAVCLGLIQLLSKWSGLDVLKRE